MRTIEILFKSKKQDLIYRIDADAKKYDVLIVSGNEEKVEESGEIIDPQAFSKKIYILLHAALKEQVEIGNRADSTNS